VARLERLKAPTRCAPFAAIYRGEAPPAPSVIAGPEGPRALRDDQRTALPPSLNEFHEAPQGAPRGSRRAAQSAPPRRHWPPGLATLSDVEPAAEARQRPESVPARAVPAASKAVSSQHLIAISASCRNEPKRTAVDTVGAFRKGVESGPRPPSQCS